MFLLTACRLNIDVLAQKQLVHVVQIHIERIVAGAAHLIGGADIVVGLLRRAVDLRDDAVPEYAGIHAGADDDVLAHVEVAAVHLVDGPLGAVGACLDEGDIGQGFPGVVVVAAVGIDGLDPAGDG